MDSVRCLDARAPASGLAEAGTVDPVLARRPADHHLGEESHVHTPFAVVSFPGELHGRQSRSARAFRPATRGVNPATPPQGCCVLAISPASPPHLVAGRDERSPELSGVVGQTSSRFPAIWPIGLTSYGRCLYIHAAEPVRISWAPATM